MCFIVFSDVTFFLLRGSEHGVGREFFICEYAAFLTPVCLRLLFGNAVLAHLVNTASPHEDAQGQRLSLASIKFLWLRQIHDPSGISPALDNALSTLLSCYSALFSCPRSHFLCTIFFRWSRSVTATVSKSQWRQAFACWLF